MHSFFLLCVVLGGAVLALQVLLSLFGFDSSDAPDFDLPDGGDVDVDVDAGDGLNLLSVRALAAGAAVFGAFGLWLDTVLWSPLAALGALVPGFGATLATAWLTRLMFRAESSGTLDLTNALGQRARVNLTVPANGAGAGLIAVTVQGRSVELRAITRGAESFPTGATVSVLTVDPETDTAEVVPTPMIEG